MNVRKNIRKVFNNYDVEISLHSSADIILECDDDIVQVLSNLIELIEDNTEENAKTNRMLEHLSAVRREIVYYKK